VSAAAVHDLAVVTTEGLVYEVDPETGEVLQVRAEEGPFIIDSRERADWVLGKMLALDAQRESIQHSDVVQQARAILANAEAMTADLDRKRAAIERRFGAELAQFAKANLGKTKTWKGLYGSVAFRSQSPRICAQAPEAAARWAAKQCSESLRLTFDLKLIGDADARQALIELAQESGDAAKAEFKVSWLPDSVKAGFLADPSTTHGTGLQVEPESESVTIRTGVGS